MARPTYASETDQMLRAICHDVRAPVRQTLEFVSMLEEELAALGTEQDSELATLAGYIVQAAERMVRVVGALERVVWARSARIDRSTVTVEELVDDASKQVADRVDIGMALVEVVGGATPLSVDPSLFALAVSELLANAVQFSEAPASIRITATTTAETTTVSFSDRGSGMRPSDTEVVCDLFTRCHPPSVAGPGVGLTVAKAIVERHGGTIGITSDPGEGTEVLLSLPNLHHPPPGATDDLI